MSHQDPDSLIPGRKTGRPRKRPKPKEQPFQECQRLVKDEIERQKNPKTHLDPWDMLALERAELDQLKAHRALDQANARALQAGQDVTAAITGVTAADDSYRHLADDLAKRYGFAWAQTSYNPETGELVGH